MACEQAYPAVDTTSQDTAPAQRPSLLTLPQELIDIIFDYAYSGTPGASYISRYRWDRREKQKRKLECDDVQRPFPAVKATEWMISKRFFTTAAQSFLQKENFHDRNYVLNDACLGKNSLLFHYVTAATVFQHDFRYFATLPRLSNLTIKIHDGTFDDLYPKFAWRHTIEDEEFRTTEIYRQIMQCHSLQQFAATPRTCRHADTASEKDMWKRNVAAFQTLLTRDLDERNERCG